MQAFQDARYWPCDGQALVLAIREAACLCFGPALPSGSWYRRTLGLLLSAQKVLKRSLVQHRFSQQLLELVVLFLRVLQSLGVRNGHAAELRRQFAVGGPRDSRACGTVRAPWPLPWPPSAPRRSFLSSIVSSLPLLCERLYIGFVLTTGSRSRTPEVSARARFCECGEWRSSASFPLR